jgi:hypothetical protein
VTTGISRDPASHGEDLRPVPAAAYDRASWRESAACRQAISATQAPGRACRPAS